MIDAQGRLVATIGDARVSAVDVRDSAAMTAIALSEEGHDGKTYTITGPTAVTHTEMASALWKAIERPVASWTSPRTRLRDAESSWRAAVESTAWSRTTRSTRG